MTARQLPGRAEHTRANGPGKRLADVSLAGAALLIIWPLLAVLGLVVRVSSAGPALFRQERIGRGMRPFTMLKLRTMVDGAGRPVAQTVVAGRAAPALECGTGRHEPCRAASGAGIGS